VFRFKNRTGLFLFVGADSYTAGTANLGISGNLLALNKTACAGDLRSMLSLDHAAGACNF